MLKSFADKDTNNQQQQQHKQVINSNESSINHTNNQNFANTQIIPQIIISSDSQTINNSKNQNSCQNNKSGDGIMFQQNNIEQVQNRNPHNKDHYYTIFGRKMTSQEADFAFENAERIVGWEYWGLNEP